MRRTVLAVGGWMMSIVVCSSGTALAQGLDVMTARLPAGANAIIAADVGYLRESPQAGQMRWVARGADSGATAVLPSMPGVKHVCLGAHLELETLRPDWELGLIEVSPLPSLDQIAKSVRGYTDTIAGSPAAWSPAGACYVGLDAQTLVSAQPGDRQLIARWIEGTRTAGGARGSAYLRSAASAVTTQTPIVVAMDLRDAFAAPAIASWLVVGSADEVMKAVKEPVKMATLLSSIRGVTIKVNVGGATTAVAMVDFDADTAPLAPIAKALFLEVLSNHGVKIPDMSAWQFTTAGKTVTAQGPLSDQGLRQLLSVLQAPSPQTEVAASGSGAGARGGASPGAAASTPAAAASAKYFSQVGAVLNGINMGSSLSEQSGWLWRDAKRIDALPVANVDPDLIKWGASVSANLRQAASICDAGQQRVLASSQSAQAPTGSYSMGLDDSAAAQRDAQYRADLENYRRQNRQAATQIRSQVTAEANKPIQLALDSRGQMRATMVARYGGGFQ